jgi:hypothetical protein
MKTILMAFASLLVAGLLASASMAQVQRTFVSGLGNDGNPCSRAAPCRTFPQAISQTNASGEIYVLDSAGYAAFTITKSVSIVAPPGVTAGISVFSGNGITINAVASDIVILRGLTVNNQGSSGSGIVFNSAGGTLHVENCVVNGFSSGEGVSFFGTAGNLEVKDSIMRGNKTGISIAPGAGTTLAAIDQVRLESGVTGLVASDGSRVTIRNSIASRNSIGFRAFTVISDAELNIENCVASNNSGSGIDATSDGKAVSLVRVSNSTATDNGGGLVNQGSPAVLLSRGNNTVEGNAINLAGAIGSYAAK